MMTRKHRIRPRPVLLVLCSLILPNLLGLAGSLSPVRAQSKRVIVVNAEQPNLWTLEQAHYLLAQMHRSDREGVAVSTFALVSFRGTDTMLPATAGVSDSGQLRNVNN